MKSDNIERILNVDLVLRKIVGYLEPRDLRAAVLVSRLFSEQVSNSEYFCLTVSGAGKLSWPDESSGPGRRLMSETRMFAVLSNLNELSLSHSEICSLTKEFGNFVQFPLNLSPSEGTEDQRGRGSGSLRPST